MRLTKLYYSLSIFFYFTCAIFNAHAQDTTYYYIHKKKICLTVPITSKFLVLKFKDANSGNNLTYMPSINILHGIDIHTDYFGLSITPSFLNYKPRKDLFGKSKFRDFQINLYPKRFVVDLTFQQYQGYFLRNTNQFQEFSGQNFDIREDLKTISGALNFFYILNYKKFTFEGPFLFSATQKKSAGSLIIGTSAAGIYYNSDSGIVNPLIRSKFSRNNHILSGNAYHFTLNIGYGATIVFLKKFYISGSIIPGFGFCNIYNNLTNNTTQFYAAKQTVHLNYRIGLGYDNRNWYAGLYGIIHEMYFFGIEKSTFQYNMMKIKLFVGKRFDISNFQNRVAKKLRLNKNQL